MNIISATVPGLRGPAGTPADPTALNAAAATAQTAAATATAAAQALAGPVAQVIGRPSGSVLLDGTAVGAGALISRKPVAVASALSAVEFFAHTAGAIQVRAYDVTGAIVTTSASIAIGAAGDVTLSPSDFGTITVPAGGYVGLLVPASGGAVPVYTAEVSDDLGWAVSISPASNYSTNNRFQVRFTLTSQAVVATPATVAGIQSDVAGLKKSGTGLAALLTPRTQSIGLTSGDPLANPYTTRYGYSIAVDVGITDDATALALQIWAAQAGTCQLIRGAMAAGVFTRTGCSAPIAVPAPGTGPVTVAVPAGFLPLKGERVFIFSPTQANGGCGLITTNYIAPPVGVGLLQTGSEVISGMAITTFAGASVAAILTATYNATVLTSPNYSAIDYTARRSSFRRTLLSTSYLPAVMAAGSWYHGIEYGQSNSNGSVTGSVLSAAQPYVNLTFGSGPRASRSGNSWGAGSGSPGDTSPGTSTAIPLVENATSIADGGGVGAEAESPCSGEANWFTRLGIKRGALPSAHVVFQSAAGHGSYAISQLNKGSAWYSQIRSHVVDAKALATAAAQGYEVQSVSWIQGEQDCVLGTSYATYLAALKQLAIDLDTDLRSDAGGQAEHIHLLVAGTGSPGTGSLANLGNVTQAQLDAAAQSPNIHFVTPMYPFYWPTSAGLHMLAQGALRIGRYFGRARDQLIKEQRKPDFLQPLSATVAAGGGLTLTARFNVPTAPLVLDTSQLGLATNYGIRVTDDTGDLTISNIAVASDGLALTMTLNRALGTNPYFRCARDYLGAGISINNGASSNIRDSTGDFETCTVGGVVYRMDHWAPAVQLPIIALEV